MSSKFESMTHMVLWKMIHHLIYLSPIRDKYYEENIN